MERIFYQTDLIDAYSGYPIYIFDTSYLPATDEVDYELFQPTLMQRLPKTPFLVILFSCGLNKINWVWGISFLKAFLSQSSSDVPNAQNVHKIIAVHESWFVKSVSQIFTNFLMSKKTFANFNTLLSSLRSSNNILISCGSLADLSDYVDVTKLKISLNVYRHDYQTTLSPAIDLHCPYSLTISSSTRFSPRTDPVFYHHFYQIFNIVDSYADQVELLFHKPGKKTNTEILFQCLKRNQIIWINDYDLNCVASCFKKILLEVPSPLIDARKIALPIKDDLEYTSRVFDSLMAEEHKNVVLFQIVSLCRRIVNQSLVTKHSNVSILKCLSHALTHESSSGQNKDSIPIAVSLLSKVLHHWKDILPRYLHRFKTVQQIAGGDDATDSMVDELYNMSYDIIMQTSISSDEEAHVESLVYPAPLVKDIQESTGFLAKDYPREKPSWNPPFHNVSNNGRTETPTKTKIQATEIPEAEEEPAKNVESPHKAAKEALIHVQFPPQKYKFERPEVETKPISLPQQPQRSIERLKTMKKPVIRGRKVGELTRIFEERSQAIKILNTM